MKIIHSYFSDVLPVVSFQLEDGITHEEAMTLIEAGQSGGQTDSAEKPKDRGKITAHSESLLIGDTVDTDDNDDLDLFTRNLMKSDFGESNSLSSQPPKHVVVGRDILRSLNVADVIVIPQPDPLPYKYLKNMVPAMRIIKCQQCYRVSIFQKSYTLLISNYVFIVVQFGRF